MIRNILLLWLLCPAFLLAQKSLFYQNPILSGFYPDPSICNGADGYYMTNSTFAYFPGLPVFYSKDLVNWEQIGNAMDRNEQLPLMGAGISRGLFAPAITYHKGTYYIVCTLVDKGGNFVISATNPKGPWSNPIFVPQVNGIDPSLFFDDNDSAYLVYNSIPPNNKSLWNGHRTIRMYAYDARLGMVKGEERLLVNGGADTSKQPVWIEGPHIYHINGYYYLMCAEGGTAYNHSEVIFRSKNVWGPYESYSGNPILTQRHLDRNRSNPVTTTGHADMVETDDGKWYAVFLGCRPYEGDYYNIGRETFMLPVEWKNGWPHILEGNAAVGRQYPVPMAAVTKKVNNPFNGNLVYIDRFESATLNPRWMMMRNMHTAWYKTGKGLELQVQPQTVGGRSNPSYLAFRFQHHYGIAETSLRFTASDSSEKAGLLLFQNETHFYYLCQSFKDGRQVVQLLKSTTDSLKMETVSEVSINDPKGALQLSIEANGDKYNFSYSLDGKTKQSIAAGIDARYLSTKIAGGFVGCTVGPYGTSMGKPSTSKAFFASFTYRGNEK